MILYPLLAAFGFLLWGTWWGDPTIYLCYAHPFQFNAGEFSASMTSPVWHLLTWWMEPWVFRAFSLAVSFGALRAVMQTQEGDAKVAAGALVFPALVWGLMGYETGLAVWVTVEVWKGRFAWLLPLVRPEGAVIVLWQKKWAHLIPFAVWALIAYALGDGLTSVESRLDNFTVRYLTVFYVYIVLEVLSRWRWATVPALLLAGAVLFREGKIAWGETQKGYDFDTITLKAQADYLNGLEGGTLEAYEIQIRYHLNEKWRVVSPEGLVKGRGDYVLSCDRWQDLNAQPLETWDINRPGFLKWASVGRR